MPLAAITMMEECYGFISNDEFSRDQCLKVALIREALCAEPADVIALRRLAIGQGGLLTNDIRRQVWPILLDVNSTHVLHRPDDESLVNHRDYRQVILDVSRSLRRFPPGMEDAERLLLQEQMVNLIMTVLVRHDELYYYQGFHDICVTILLVVGDDLSYLLLDKLSMLHLRGFMDANMEQTRHMLSYLYPIISKVDPRLYSFMQRAEVGSIFALSWLITWYGHVLAAFGHIVRLYDFFIASHPLMPIYLAVAIVLHRKEDIYSTECEMCYIHSLLSNIPDNLPYEDLITVAGDLFIQFPPASLAQEAIKVFDETYGKSRKTLVRRDAQQHASSACDHSDYRIHPYWILFGAIASVTVAWYIQFVRWYM